MSQLRQPAARADRREGGRHGRPAGRTAPRPAETHIRPQLLRLAVLPPVAVALSASAAVLFAVRSTGARPGPALWSVLAGACLVTVAGIVIAAVAADRAAATVRDRVLALRRTTARGQAELRSLVEQLRKGEGPPPRRAPQAPAPGADDFDQLAADLTRAQDVAVTAVVQATRLSSQAGSRQKVEVFVNLARRLQSLVHREISILDDLENDVEDPDLLKGLFHVDHLATRIRRHAENLAVLGGAVSRRQWSHPVSMTEVMRSAIAEVEQYSRVKLVPPIDGTLRGHAVADCIHLLAELVENATVFSAPHTQVLLRANLVTSGLAIEVEDRGLGMPVTEQNKMNALLADPDQVNVDSLLQDGRIGLFVVSQLARRHGITVRLGTNIYGGVQAVLVLPQGLLGMDQGEQVPHVRRAAAAATADSVLAPGAAIADGHSALGHSGDTRDDAPSAPPAPAPLPGGITPAPAPLHGGMTPAPAPLPGGMTPAPAPLPGGVTPAPAPLHGGITAVPRPRPDQPSTERLQQLHLKQPPPGAPGAAPLPQRHAGGPRLTPADAVPGIRPEDRQSPEQPPPPLAVNGTVRGTMERPRLPRRRAQEHLAPQLRGGPAPRQDDEPPAGHDPGLMAAFQRGITLAEAAEPRELPGEAPGAGGGAGGSAG
ncbi:ATP-binding protein [Streptomyces kunmingensis]|uniref:histidine kinase n=1 Tax=Streptomyces kunmingensis TaxID=68225 RepID=A0ABU6CJ61_9ACTN|nr:ATP-binding protein [Streptomyces kunmingensis]MEB3964765.1 ATP-binding protein [Streptomyces kunmingensis]